MSTVRLGPAGPLDREAVRRSIIAAVAGFGLFIYGYLGGEGPGFVTAGWLMIFGGALIGYSVLTLLRLSLLRRRLALTPAEIEAWGAVLDSRQQSILEALKAKRRVAAVAADLLATDGVPEEVTLKYIISLGSSSSADPSGA